jgi:hypothetical protein
LCDEVAKRADGLFAKEAGRNQDCTARWSVFAELLRGAQIDGLQFVPCSNVSGPGKLTGIVGDDADDEVFRTTDRAYGRDQEER